MKVKANDTLSKIARQKGVTLSDIKLANPDIDYDTIRVGQEINIPRNGNIERIEQARNNKQVSKHCCKFHACNRVTS